ncbi:MAG: hypothetical protein DIZ80_15560 [endosymbiont of Galathealinum brachiosum]|uniref:Uncharacterized protein n=1 Tax=endosymbiont of Galathealinum brachiosum TaxID=2200906 RepID=A0A370D9A8_9GAMM|nr:MAG: hypothetical protein DIZ80_15560 [endosymbiont of Galathealinum brachiosum]
MCISDFAGPESVTLISGVSDANGVAEVIWQTSTPNRKRACGTAAGAYTVTTTNVSGSWNGVAITAKICVRNKMFEFRWL